VLSLIFCLCVSQPFLSIVATIFIQSVGLQALNQNCYAMVLSKFRTKINVSVVSQLLLTSCPQNCARQGVHHLFSNISNSAAWAHVELTMLLKKVILHLLELYLAFVKFLQNICGMRESGLVSIEAWAHTELTMLLKYVKLLCSVYLSLFFGMKEIAIPRSSEVLC